MSYRDEGALAAAGGVERMRFRLRTDGFAVIDGLFTPAAVSTVETLLDLLFAELAPKLRPPFDFPFARDMQPSRDDADGAPSQPEILYAAALQPQLLCTEVFRASAALARLLGGDISRSFDHAIYKMPRNSSVTPWHQDAAFSAKRPSRSHGLSFWIPLQDVSASNGCLEYVAGSHRGPIVPHDRYARRAGDWGYAATQKIDPDRHIVCPVARCGVVIHTPYTLHAAGQNLSAQPRKAWIIQFSRLGTARLIFKRMMGKVPAPLGGVSDPTTDANVPASA